MAEAEAAEAEVAELCEELSRVMRKPSKKPATSRGGTDRPSVPRRRVRKVAAAR